MSLIEEISQLTDKQLIKDLSHGAEGFQDRVFELYVQEAQRRNIDLSEQSVKTAKESVALSQSEKDGRILVILTIVFAGPFSFVPGIFLLRKNDEKMPLYTQGKRAIGLVGIFLSFVIWFGVLIFFLRAV
jgi:hypothetical protein